MHFTMDCTAEPFRTLGLLSITEPQMIRNQGTMTQHPNDFPEDIHHFRKVAAASQRLLLLHILTILEVDAAHLL